MIFGNSGSGKTTLARLFRAKHGLAHLDLDCLAWEPTTPPVRRSISDSEKEIRDFLVANRAWVIEGCYSDLLAVVANDASEVVFLNPGVEQCIANCRSRPWEPHKYPSREAQNKNLGMLIEWVRQYPERTYEFSLKSHQAIYDGFHGKKVEHRNKVEIT